MIRISSSTLAVLALVLGPAPADAQPQQQRGAGSISARMDSLAAATVQEQALAGLSVAVVRGRETLLFRGYGAADLENGAAADPAATVFRVGSATKQFTAALIMRLVEQGRVNLDAPIRTYLPEYPLTAQAVTVRQLLNHTSGIYDFTSFSEAWLRGQSLDLPHTGMLAIFATQPLVFPAGSWWMYDNSGYYLLGMIVERIAQRPYADVLREALLEPLGMKSSAYCQFSPVVQGRASGYDLVGRRQVNTAYISMLPPFSAGALCATAGDLMRWNVALHTGRVVSPASYLAMTTPTGMANGRVPTPPGFASTKNVYYGFGLVMDSLGAVPIIQHPGNINGFNSTLLFVPKDTLSVVVLTNTSTNAMAVLAKQLARIALGQPLQPAAPVQPSPPLPPAVPLPHPLRARYTGTYALQGANHQPVPMRVFQQAGEMYFQISMQPMVRMRYLGANSFSGDESDPTLRLGFVFAVPGGPATTMLYSNQGSTPAPVHRVGP